MKTFLLSLSFFALVISASCVCLADDEGHHHEDLTQGQLGTVHFPVSCDGKVQQNFERGIALLHSFWYSQVEKQFTVIAKDDPKCAMAHWGVAMGMWHQLWDEPDAKTIAQGLAEVKEAEALHPKTQREKDYIAAIGAFYSDSQKRDHHARAVAYSDAMEGIYKRYPEDKEAAAFYALSLLASAPEGDTTFANRKKAASVLEVLFKEEPNHPGVAHYLIHSYDKPQLAALGLPAARRYAEIAPASPHALHMPSHIFARLGLWQDDIKSNLASIAATRQTAQMGDSGHQFHAMDFLVYAYMQSGREEDAEALVEEIKTMPEDRDSMYGSDYDPRTNSLSVFPARIDLELRHWQDAAALKPVAGALPGDLAVTYWARAIGAARSGNVKQANEDVAQIESIHETLVKEKKPYFAAGVEDSRLEAMAWVNHAAGKNGEAVAALRSLAEKEEARGDEVGDIPAREMLADMLMEMKQPTQALAEYETDLKFNPGRFDGLYGAAQSAKAAQQENKATEFYAELVKSCTGATSARPELARAKGLVASK
jgi:tetratricopeptide (TPR) repeat protein